MQNCLTLKPTGLHRKEDNKKINQQIDKGYLLFSVNSFYRLN